MKWAAQRRCGMKNQHPWSGRLVKPRSPVSQRLAGATGANRNRKESANHKARMSRPKETVASKPPGIA
jgi:hypothetical protein